MNYCVPINKLSELLRDEFIQFRKKEKNVRRCFTSTETIQLIRDGRRVEKVMKTQAHLPVHSGGRSFFRGALRPQKPYGLLGTGEEWDRE